VTVPAAPWPAAKPAPTVADAGRLGAMDIIALGLSVLMVLIYTQPWVMLAPTTDSMADAANSGPLRVMYFAMYAGGLFVLAFKPWQAVRGLIAQPFLIALLLVAAASMIWSVAPDQTMRRVVGITLTTLSGVALGARWRWSTLTEILATGFAIIAVLSLLLGALVPSIGRMTELFPGAWRGVFSEKNGFGGLMAFAFLLFAGAALLAPKRRLLWWPMAGLALALLVLSTSKTSLVSLMLGVAALGFVLLVRRGGAIAVVATYFAVIGLIGLGAGVILAPDTFLAVLGKDATFTGRTKIWDAILRLTHERPWLGYGYGAVWTDTSGWGPLARIVKETGFTPQHAHNSWLEQWLGMGLVGMWAWIACYLTTLGRTIVAIFRHPGALVAFPFLIVFTVMSLTESIAFTYNDLRWVMFVALSVRLALTRGDEAV
jgi:exopolysaccharide production protein ExoQ